MAFLSILLAHTKKWDTKDISNMLCSWQSSNVFMQTNAYLRWHDAFASLNAYSKLITYALQKLVWSALCTWDDTCIWCKDSPLLYVFLEFLAIFQHKKCYWHHDITFYSLNCVHTHRFRPRQPTSAPHTKKILMWFLQLASQREHANRVRTSSGAIKVILCYHFCFCMSYERAM